MARDGSGNYNRPVSDYVYDTVISETDMNTEMDQIAAALTASIAKDGQTPTTAVIPFANGINTDTIVENGSGNGVTVESVLLKDGRVDWAKGGDIASAGTTDISGATGNYLDITGTATITALGTAPAGAVRILQFDGALTLTHNASSLILPGGANITTAAGDVATFVSEGSGNWRCVSYTLAGLVPSKPRFLAYNSVTDSNVTGAGAAVTVDFDTEVFDEGGDFTGDTFTAPVTGHYQFNVQVRVSGLSAATDFLMSLVTSNRTYFGRWNSPPNSTFTGTLSVLADMDAADTAHVTMQVSGMAGNTADIDGGGNGVSTFSGFLVG